jgi:hypothetical protein
MKLFQCLIYGHQWQRVIQTSVSDLKVFHLGMHDMLSLSNHFEIRSDAINADGSFAELCTLLDTPTYREASVPDLQTSTDPHNDRREFDQKLTRIQNEAFLDHSISSSMCLSNLKYLSLKLPINV